MASSKVARIGGSAIPLAKGIGLGVTHNDRGRLLVFFSTDDNRVTALVGQRLHRNSDVNFSVQVGESIQLRSPDGVIVTARLEKLLDGGKNLQIATC